MKITLIRLTVLGFGLAAAASFVTGCDRGSAQSLTPPPTVTIEPVEQKQIVEWSEFTGHTEPVDSVDIRPRVSGYIQKVEFQSGQLVKKGDVLFVIDPRWNQAVFDQRQAEYDQARSEAERIDLLLENHAISKEEADGRKARYEEAKAALDSARLDLDYTQVRAPIDGRVSRALLTEGNYVSGVCRLGVPAHDHCFCWPDLRVCGHGRKFAPQIQRARRRQQNGNQRGGKDPVQLQLADETDFPHEGYIESLDNQLDPDTGSILLRAVFPNTDGQIVPGLFARIRIPMSDKHPALLVDEQAIGTDQSQKYVFTLTSSNTVAYQTVDLGPAIDGERVIESGLQPGEEIVVNGLQRVRTGMVVAPEEATAARPSELKTAMR